MHKGTLESSSPNCDIPLRRHRLDRGRHSGRGHCLGAARYHRPYAFLEIITDGGVLLLVRQLQGRQTIVVLQQDIAAGGHQLLADGHVAKHGGGMQCGLSVGQLAEIGSVFEQHGDYGGMALMSRLEEGRGAVATHGVHIGAVLEQHLAYVILSHLGCYPQGRGAVYPLDIDLGTSLNQQRQNRAMAILGGDKNRRGPIL